MWSPSRNAAGSKVLILFCIQKNQNLKVLLLEATDAASFALTSCIRCAVISAEFKSLPFWWYRGALNGKKSCNVETYIQILEQMLQTRWCIFQGRLYNLLFKFFFVFYYKLAGCQNQDRFRIYSLDSRLTCSMLEILICNNFYPSANFTKLKKKKSELTHKTDRKFLNFLGDLNGREKIANDHFKNSL